jgi:hypothetical protein
MRYQVPQFIEVEDKIFEPLTLKQFIYIAAGAGIAFLLWSFLPKFLAVVFGIPVVLFFLALAFYQYNGRPFIVAVESGLKFFFSTKRFIWKKVDKKPEEIKAQNVVDQMSVPKISDSKLKELSWSLDVQTKIEKAEKEKGLGLRL